MNTVRFYSLLDELNAVIKEYQKEGIRIWDYENTEFAINDVYYAAEEDKIYFKCEEI